MRSHVAIVFLFAAISFNSTALSMNNIHDDITLKILCDAQNECIYRGEDVDILICIKNKGKSEVSIPVAYLQKAGPIMTLIDERTGKTLSIRRNRPPSKLLKELKIVAPGSEADLHWSITREEVETFRHEIIAISVEVKLIMPAVVDGVEERMMAIGTTKIVGKSIFFGD